MKRVIITPPDLAPAALAELKGWLAITTASEDQFLTGLLRAALETCEGFIGQVPLEAVCEEVLAADGAGRARTARPVQAVSGVEGIDAAGARFAIAPGDYLADLDAAGGAHLRLLRPGAAGRIAVRFVAGLAPDWGSLPESLRHGVVRLAADGYRRRDGEAAEAHPPAAIAALWRPWRRMRLAC